MSAPDRYQCRRDKDGLGVWEYRGKVADCDGSDTHCRAICAQLYLAHDGRH
jgi:hypothetical protein